MKDTYISRASRQTTRLDADGVLVRRCAKCTIEKPLETDFYVNRRQSDGSVAVPSDYAYECKLCSVKTCGKINAVRRRGPERKKLLASKAAAARAKRATPEGKAKHAAAQKRYAERVKADPRKRAEHAERQRLDYRMRREREMGEPVARSFRNVRRVPSPPSYLPSAPLARLLERIVDERKAVSEVLGDRERSTNGGEIGDVCADLGINERTYRGWRTGEYSKVRIGVAEKVLLNAGVEWFTVYSYDDHAAQFLAEVPA